MFFRKNDSFSVFNCFSPLLLLDLNASGRFSLDAFSVLKAVEQRQNGWSIVDAAAKHPSTYWEKTGFMVKPAPTFSIPAAHRSRPEAEACHRTHPGYWLLRRAQDILFSFLGLFVLAPFLLLLCLAIWLDSPGASPVFRQERVGKNGHIFTMYKFRTMVPHAEEELQALLSCNEMDGPVFKIQKDPRITRLGSFLRRTSLDELPQLVNVLRGEMTLVGPRPALPREVQHYTAYEWQRLSVTPGLSCYWQITPHRNRLSFAQWMELDLRYLKERSFWVDWKILFLTVRSVLMGYGT